ncbi:SchA/CurD like domain-containing protein [Nonomuraea polychroma]|uniref:SchA/CurD like domain-containing protein n=1 Tax=Nonomuraea polychroma TaxID=46176 RepID=A0A438MEG6_9ACTN|nr:SchA/CurD-like domain-containing protein [Nonomuraea polychroma]RVX44152.1 SchA/CurD like domain-containing protein [Nonomuraea polychroma]
MPFAAINYGVKPGHEDEIAEIFAPGSFTRAESPVMRDETGTEVGRLLATGLFIQDTDMVRVIQYEGDLAAVGRHMATQQGVHEAERRIAPLLATPRDTATAAGFQAHFGRSIMTLVHEHVRRADVATAMIAVRYALRTDSVPAVGELLAAAPSPSEQDGPIVATASFLRGSTLVRVYQCEGDVAAAAEHLLAAEEPAALAGARAEQAMRCISQLSVLSLPESARR